jgi:hypothetical protein
LFSQSGAPSVRLSAFGSAAISRSVHKGNTAPMVAYSPEEQKERDDAERKSLETVRNRLFINDALEREKIMDLWTKALRDMDHTKDMQLFKKRYEEVEIAIRKLAREVIS